MMHKKFDKHLKMWYHINQSYYMRYLFKKSWQFGLLAIRFEGYVTFKEY